MADGKTTGRATLASVTASEFFSPAEQGIAFFDTAESTPCGLWSSSDTCLEMCYLNGNDPFLTCSPIEAGLGFSPLKPEFTLGKGIPAESVLTAFTGLLP
jgi:hypothetical protein